jgi:hypothetical protein
MTAGGDEPPSVAPADGDGEILVSMSVPVEGGDEISLLVEYDESPLPISGAGTGSNMSVTVLSTAGSDGPLSTAVPDINGPTTSSSSNRTLLTNGDGSSSVEGQSPASAAPHVSPLSIRPFPKCGDTSTKKRRKSMRSEIFIASPFKNQLRAKQMEVEDRRLSMADKQTENLSKKSRRVANSKTKNKKKKQDMKTTYCDSIRKGKLFAKSQKDESARANSAKKAKKSSSADTSASNNIFCPACEEIYREPPTEDWIQCQQCLKWWHETCSSYEGGSFVCDLC